MHEMPQVLQNRLLRGRTLQFCLRSSLACLSARTAAFFAESLWTFFFIWAGARRRGIWSVFSDGGGGSASRGKGGSSGSKTSTETVLGRYGAGCLTTIPGAERTETNSRSNTTPIKHRYSKEEKQIVSNKFWN